MKKLLVVLTIVSLVAFGGNAMAERCIGCPNVAVATGSAEATNYDSTGFDFQYGGNTVAMGAFGAGRSDAEFEQVAIGGLVAGAGGNANANAWDPNFNGTATMIATPGLNKVEANTQADMHVDSRAESGGIALFGPTFGRQEVTGGAIQGNGAIAATDTSIAAGGNITGAKYRGVDFNGDFISDGSSVSGDAHAYGDTHVQAWHAEGAFYEKAGASGETYGSSWADTDSADISRTTVGGVGIMVTGAEVDKNLGQGHGEAEAGTLSTFCYKNTSNSRYTNYENGIAVGQSEAGTFRSPSGVHSYSSASSFAETPAFD